MNNNSYNAIIGLKGNKSIYDIIITAYQSQQYVKSQLLFLLTLKKNGGTNLCDSISYILFYPMLHNFNYKTK